MKDARDEGKPERKGPAEEPEADLERLQRILREHLEARSRRSPEERFADLEANAVRAVRALAEELRRRRAEEDAAGIIFGRESASLEAKAFRTLFGAFIGEPVDAHGFGLVDVVKRSASAMRAVERFWEMRRVPEVERDLFAPGRLAEVLRGAPEALWDPEVAAVLDLWLHPVVDSPEVVVIPRADGSCSVLNIGSKPTTFGEWLGLSTGSSERGGTGSRALRGKVIPPSFGDGVEGERKAIEEALGGAPHALVLRNPRVSGPRGWRTEEARAAYLDSFLDGLQRGPNLDRFKKDTGLDVKTEAFRLARFRARKAAAANVTSAASSNVTDGGSDFPREGSTNTDRRARRDDLLDHERGRGKAPRLSSDHAPLEVPGHRPAVREAEPREVPVRRGGPRGVHAGEDLLLDRRGDREPRDRRGGRVRKPP
jgi:hypothetical protein